MTIKEIVNLLFEQGIEITREVLLDKMQEAYDQGREEGYQNQIDEALSNIRYNTMLEIKRKKQILYEQNFYNKPKEEDVIEMKALEFLEENISEIITYYKEN